VYRCRRICRKPQSASVVSDMLPNKTPLTNSGLTVDGGWLFVPHSRSRSIPKACHQQTLTSQVMVPRSRKETATIELVGGCRGEHAIAIELRNTSQVPPTGMLFFCETKRERRKDSVSLSETTTTEAVTTLSERKSTGKAKVVCAELLPLLWAQPLEMAGWNVVQPRLVNPRTAERPKGILPSLCFAGGTGSSRLRWLERSLLAEVGVVLATSKVTPGRHGVSSNEKVVGLRARGFRARTN
jgi:hypothetical protein